MYQPSGKPSKFSVGREDINRKNTLLLWTTVTVLYCNNNRLPDLSFSNRGNVHSFFL